MALLTLLVNKANVRLTINNLISRLESNSMCTLFITELKVGVYQFDRHVFYVCKSITP